MNMKKSLFLYLSIIFLLSISSLSYAADKKNTSETQGLNKELAYRVEFGGASDVAFLLNKGANPNIMKGIIPLVSVAAERNDALAIPILRELVKAGADLNNGGNYKLFPIIIAARNGDVELMEYLLDENVKVNVIDRNGLGPYEIAEHEGHYEILELIEELVVKREDAARMRLSPETYNNHLNNLLMNRCYHQYTIYYYKSKMGKTPDNIAEIIKSFTDKVSFAATELMTLFKVEPDYITKMQEYASKQINTELVDLISNRYRRKKGVGSTGDKEKRCQKIAAEFLKNNKIKTTKK